MAKSVLIGTGMRTIAALASLTSLLLLLPGCPAGPFGCGAPDEVDAAMVLERGGDSLVLCANDGFAATLASGKVLEGRYDWSEDLRGTDGASGDEAFVLRWADDGSLSSEALGTGWREASLDATALHYAGVACTDLETRAWWASGPSAQQARVDMSAKAAVR